MSGIDRRVSRTQGALRHALMNLILKKGYDAVTVQDICEEADIGRSTFYAHFTGKKDLKKRGLDHLRAMLSTHQKATAGQGLGFSLHLFEHAREHLALYRALIGSDGGAVSLEAVRGLIADLVRAEVRGDASVPPDLRVQFITGAFMAVLTWWLDGGAKMPPADIDALFRRMAGQGALPLWI